MAGKQSKQSKPGKARQGKRERWRRFADGRAQQTQLVSSTVLPTQYTHSTLLSLALPRYIIRLLATSPCSSRTAPGPVALAEDGKEREGRERYRIM